MHDPDPRVRLQAIRASETLYKQGDRSFTADYRALATDTDTDVAIQALLTANVLKTPEALASAKSALDANKSRGVQFVAGRIANPPPAAGRAGGRGASPLTMQQQQSIQHGETIYNELCFSCHGNDGRGTPTPGGSGSTLAPPLAGSARVTGHRDYIVKALLHGLTGPIDGRTYPEVMVAMGGNKDEWIADVASFVRSGFGNTSGTVTIDDVARVRTLTADRKTAWTAAELDASLPRLLPADGSWKVTASHQFQGAPQPNAAGGFSYVSDPAGALTYQGWSTGLPQAPGMWLQIEMPRAARLTEIQFTAPAPMGAYDIRVSADGANWSAPVAQASGGTGAVAVSFAPVSARYVRFTSTAAAAAPWSMRLVRLYETQN
jgi:mono/diheme cytochrome c family protein